MKFLPYNPEQAYLLPPRVAECWVRSISVFFCVGWWIDWI